MKKGLIFRDKCPICNSASSKSIFNRSFKEEIIKGYMIEGYQGNADLEFLEDVKWEIVKCNRCNFAYQKYVLDDERSSELYDKWIDPVLALEWKESENKLENEQQYASKLNFAKKYFKKESSQIKILDYGAGFGDFLVFSKEMGFDTYAYEYSVERIRFLEDKGIKVINDKNEMLFDLIILSSVLEHLTYPEEILKIIRSKLNKNALVHVTVPNCPDFEKKLRKTDNITDPKELKEVLLDTSVSAFQHINFFTNHTLKLLLKSVGLKPVNPFKQPLTKPLTIKSFIRPFYYYYKSFFVTSFFLVKTE
jgi:2-polyprenyl-3-methyl-5-hydroxy-6-metoxy-1,4-benzoquinol methylase